MCFTCFLEVRFLLISFLFGSFLCQHLGSIVSFLRLLSWSQSFWELIRLFRQLIEVASLHLTDLFLLSLNFGLFDWLASFFSGSFGFWLLNCWWGWWPHSSYWWDTAVSSYEYWFPMESGGVVGEEVVRTWVRRRDRCWLLLLFWVISCWNRIIAILLYLFSQRKIIILAKRMFSELFSIFMNEYMIISIAMNNWDRKNSKNNNSPPIYSFSGYY